MEGTTEAQSFRDEICGQFSAATGCNANEAENILFKEAKANDFTNISGEQTLELVRSELEFYAKTKASGLSGKEIDEMLYAQLVQAQKSIYSHIEKSLKQKAIGISEYEERVKKFIAATENKQLATAIEQRAEKIIGQKLYAESLI